jgi:hypothetical protein
LVTGNLPLSFTQPSHQKHSLPDLRGKGMVVRVSRDVLTDGCVGPRIEKSEKGYVTEQDKTGSKPEAKGASRDSV